MPDAHRVTIGPITKKDAHRRRIVVGPLTWSQFDDMDRIDLLGSASVVDLATPQRSQESVLRAMRRLEVRGWVVSSGECYRLTDRGSLVLGLAVDYLDTMSLVIEGEEDDG
jgi:hypothetical protein